MTVSAGTPATGVGLATTQVSVRRRLLSSPATALALVIVVFVVFGATQTDRFLDGATWINILRNAVFLVIVGVFTTLVLISGGLDLSVGSVFVAGAVGAAAAADAGLPVLLSIALGTATGIVVGLLNGVLINYAGIPSIIVTLGTYFSVRSIVVALTSGNSIGPLPDEFTAIGQGDVLGIPNLIFFAIGIAVGLLNGILINYARISSIIVTLGTLFAVRSIVVAITQGNSIGPLPKEFTAIGQGELFGIPYLIFYAIIIALLGHVLLQYANLGWSIRAIGGNSDASSRFGIPVRAISTLVYTLSGASAAFAGVLMASRLSSGPPSLGSGFELQVIAAAIIGGTSLSGSIGSIPGTVLGALLLSILSTGLVLLKVDPSLQNFAVGAILILAAGIDQFRKGRMFRRTTTAPAPGKA